MTDELNFDEWWKYFSDQFKSSKDGGFECLERLVSEVRALSAEKRIAFIDELLQREKLYFYACQLIPLFGNQRQIQEIKNSAKEIIGRNLNNDALPTYIDAIIKTFTTGDLQLLNKYYLNYQDNSFFKIPTELYEIDKELFLQAFAKKLANYPIDRICKYDGFLYLIRNVEALEYIIHNLPDELSEKLKMFAFAKSHHPMVSHDEKLKKQLLNLSGQAN